MFLLLLVFIILLGIVGAVCVVDKKGKEDVSEKDKYNADEFEIEEMKSEIRSTKS